MTGRFSTAPYNMTANVYTETFGIYVAFMLYLREAFFLTK